jgi:phosphatidylcholine synthase
MPEIHDNAGETSAATSTASARVLAFAVHIFTASGGALGLLALIAASEREWARMFLWLGLALVVDGVDGTFARALRVKEVLPRWSGDVLDFVVDYLAYIVVPAYAIAVAGLLPEPLAVPLACVIVVAGALYCADTRMKTVDNYFRGFPALWNAAAFYLILLRPHPWIAAAAVGLLAVLMFVPFPFLHPLRVKRGRALNIAVLAAWLVLAAVAVADDFQPHPFVTVAFCAIGAYFLGIGMLRRGV